jgi:cellulose synthase/poly-beta-1,6-N-acetylglucosamine synthase-like glycosyltransferase
VGSIAAQGSIPMRCERQELAGLNAARNRGVAVAEGAVLAFLDDDTRVCPGWARVLVETFQDTPCAGVGGKVELDLAGPAPAWLAGRRQYLAEYDLGTEPRWLEWDAEQGGDPLPVGANCAVRRSAFEEIGGFRPGLDRLGGSLVSNGDTEFFRRLRTSGGALRYEPRARVLHYVPPERLTVNYFLRRQYAQGVSDELLLSQDGQRMNWRHRLGLARMMARNAGMLCGDLVRGRGRTNGLIEISYWVGRFAATRMPS